MYGKKVKLRFIFIFALILITILTSYLVLNNLKSNVVYFLSPTEISNLREITNEKLRVGGMVKKNSIKIDSNNITFLKTILIILNTVSEISSYTLYRMPMSFYQLRD